MNSITFNPQVHWPFSGSVVQDIHPSLLARAGSDDTEVRVLREVASYGRQIGVLSDLVLALVDAPGSLADPKSPGGHALGQLRELVEDIGRIKRELHPLPTTPKAAQELADALRQRFPGLK
jgi:hypothetical protein